MKWCQTTFLKMKAPKQDFQSYLILWLNKLKNCKQDQKSLPPKGRKEEWVRRRVKDKEIKNLFILEQAFPSQVLEISVLDGLGILSLMKFPSSWKTKPSMGRAAGDLDLIAFALIPWAVLEDHDEDESHVDRIQSNLAKRALTLLLSTPPTCTPRPSTTQGLMLRLLHTHPAQAGARSGQPLWEPCI